MERISLKKYWKETVAGISIVIYLIANAGNSNDLNIYLGAARDLADGNPIYFVKYKEWFHYYYSVFFALALYPLTLLPDAAAQVLWMCVNMCFAWRSWTIIRSYLPLENLSQKMVQLFSFTILIFMLRFITDNLRYGQVTIMILYMALEGICQIHRNRKLLGASLIALSINIKLLPITLIPYLLYRGEYKAVFYTFLAFAVFLLLPGIFIGFDYHFQLMQNRWVLLNPANPEHLLDVSERSFHSITSLLATLLVEDAGNIHSLTIKRNIADISIDQLGIAINIARAAFVCFTLYFLRTFPFKTEKDRLKQLYELSYLLIVIPLIFPHQQQYAFYFAFPAVAYLAYFIIQSYFDNESLKPRSGYVVIALFFVSYLLMSSAFILGEFKHYYTHYKVLTYGVFILIGILAYCRPQRLRQFHS